MFSIYFTRNGDKECTQVIAQIKTDLDVEKSVLSFTWECEKQYAAELLRIHLDKKLGDYLHDITKKAYEEGYKDGKNKQKKKLWFSRNFTKGRVCI
ncbi:hypothetical protein KAU11_04185 [Candidatus Babeliales bacterium]|nr:hypothetical protein [Candidatus Babeliales bacterium]